MRRRRGTEHLRHGGKRDDLRERLAEIDYVLVPDGLQLYVGTPHTYDTIYVGDVRPNSGTGQPFLAGFTRYELPVVGESGASAWPERFPPARIDAIRARSGPNKFKSQMLLQPVDIGESRLNPDRLLPYDDPLVYREAGGQATLRLGNRQLVSATAWWDPAFGTPGVGDANVAAALYTDSEGHYWLHGVRYLTHDPHLVDETDAATQLCRQVAAFARDHYLPAITVETNGIGRFLPGLLRRELAAGKVSTSVLEAATRQVKDIRIVEAFDAVMAAGALHVHRAVWDTPFIAEMRDWRPGENGRDDGLDAVAGCLLAEPVRLPRVARPPRTDWRPGRTVTADTDFRV